MKTLFVIKIGGNVIDSDPALSAFLEKLSVLQTAWILVHGGGKLATDLSKRLGIETQMVDGRRITDVEMLKIATMVYGGLVNKRIVAALQAMGVNALGLTGADGNIITSQKRVVAAIDYGFVGDVASVNAAQLRNFLAQGLFPVLAPLTHDGKGMLLNTNADTIASEVASALASAPNAMAGSEENGVGVHLIYCFEKRGVMRSLEDDDSVISHITAQEYEELKESGVVTKGMIPKLDNAFAALRRGVKSVSIAHADSLHLLQTSTSFGTTLLLE